MYQRSTRKRSNTNKLEGGMSPPTVVELEMLWFAYLDNDNDISQLYVKANYDHRSTQTIIFSLLLSKSDRGCNDYTCVVKVLLIFIVCYGSGTAHLAGPLNSCPLQMEVQNSPFIVVCHIIRTS